MVSRKDDAHASLLKLRDLKKQRRTYLWAHGRDGFIEDTKKNRRFSHFEAPPKRKGEIKKSKEQRKR